MEMGLLLTPFHKRWALAVCSGKHRVKGKGLIRGDLLATWKIRNGASAWGLMAHISSGTRRHAQVLTLPSWDVMPVLPPQPSGGLCSGQGIGVVRGFYFFLLHVGSLGNGSPAQAHTHPGDPGQKKLVQKKVEVCSLLSLWPSQGRCASASFLEGKGVCCWEEFGGEMESQDLQETQGVAAAVGAWGAKHSW